jgi:hypothetical protein
VQSDIVSSAVKSPEDGQEVERTECLLEARESLKRKFEDHDSSDKEKETASSLDDDFFTKIVVSDGGDIVSELLARWTTVVPQEVY